MIHQDKILGGLYGALIGDACGVPYEFKSPRDIPVYDSIDMIPPEGYKRTWANIPVGTYSDDGAQILCLLECLLDDKFTVKELIVVLRKWLYEGYWSVDRFTYDVGNQTGAALRKDVTDLSGLDKEQFNGNGSLMRTLPISFCFVDIENICNTSFEMSGATHPHVRSRLCCVLYNLIAHRMIEGQDVWSATDFAFGCVSQMYASDDIHKELKIIKDFENYECTGTGYVVDSLWTAILVVGGSTSFEDAIKKSIAFGNDTDTTACIAGGLAGIKHGYDNIPQRWIDLLRNKNEIEPLVTRLIQDNG